MESEITLRPPASLTAISGVQIIDKSMTFPADLPYEDWASMNAPFETWEDGLPWWRGDWWNHGNDHYERSVQLLAIERTRTKKQTWLNNASVCKKYSPAQRAKTAHLVSFSHHAEVASADEPLRTQLLQLAHTKGWSAFELRTEYYRIIHAVEEKEHQEEQGGGAQINEEYIPVQLPLTVKSFGALIADHMDEDAERTLRDWLNERLGDAPAPAAPPPQDDEPWNVHAARLMREALEEAEAYIEIPGTYKLATERLARWIESQDREEENA